MTKLPIGWAATTLGDLIDGFQAGRNLQAQGRPASDAEFGVLKISAVSWGRFAPTENKALLPHDKPMPHERVKSGDLLISRANTTELVGAPVLVDGDHPNLMLPDKILRVLYRNEAVDRRYLLHALRAEPARLHIEAEATGTSHSMRNLSQPKMREIPIPLAPRAEQERIASKLDALLAHVDACRVRLELVPGILKRFRLATLSAAVRGELTRSWRDGRSNGGAAPELTPDLSELQSDTAPEEAAIQEWLSSLPASWVVERASQVVELGADIVYGIVQPGPKLNSGVPYVRGMDIVDGRIQVDQLLRTSPQIARRYARAAIQGGDVLLGIIRATKVAVVPDSLNGANITQGTARFRPSSRVLTHYLAVVLEAPETQRWLHSHYRGIDMPGLNLADVRRVPIPLPTVDEQAEIVRRVESLVGLADAIEARYTVARAKVDRLTPALLAKAFRGELAPQDPNDEPASALLGRLRNPAAHAEATPARKPGRRPTKARAKENAA